MHETITRTRPDEGAVRLLIVTTVAGTLRAFLLPFARHFRALGWRVDALACGAPLCPECLQAFDHVWDASWSRNPWDPRNLFAAAGQVRTIVAEEKYDLVHVHTPVAAFVTRFALRQLRREAGVKVIYTAHGFHFYRGGQPLRNLSFLALEKLAGRWTDLLITINQEDLEAGRKYRLVPKARLVHVPGIGVDTAQYNPEKVPAEAVARVRAELGLAPDEALFLMVAAFNPGKRHRDALQALARLARPHVHLALAGDGRLLPKMEELAAELGIRPQVHFLGRRSDIPVLIRAAVATCLPSEREGLARSVMESLCLEVPVVGANARGIRDLLTEDCGILVEVGDIEGLAEALAWILDHPAQARAMGKRGRERMAQYDIRHILSRHEELYAAMLSPQRQRAITPQPAQ